MQSVPAFAFDPDARTYNFRQAVYIIGFDRAAFFNA